MQTIRSEMAARRSTKVKIMVTSPELEDTVLVAAEGDNSRLSTKESFGKISLTSAAEEGQSSKPVKPCKKPAEQEEASIIRFPTRAARSEKTKASGETSSSTDVSDIDDPPMMTWKSDDNLHEMTAVQSQLGLKPTMFRPVFILSSDDENSESDISVDGDEIIPVEMLQTWENGSTFSQSDDEEDTADS